MDKDRVEGVEQRVPPNSDPLLPSGGRRWWFFDTVGLPALIITQDETGREVEYYCHDRIQAPVRLDDDDALVSPFIRRHVRQPIPRRRPGRWQSRERHLSLRGRRVELQVDRARRVRQMDAIVRPYVCDRTIPHELRGLDPCPTPRNAKTTAPTNSAQAKPRRITPPMPKV